MDILSNFYQLNPDKVLTSLEKAGFSPTGEFSQLNSYENRVFDIKLEGSNSIIAKFYRPNRWSLDSILEEHQFLFELIEYDIPAIAPLILPNKKTTQLVDGLISAYFPKVRARMPQELSLSEYEKIGSLLAQVHNVGCKQKTKYRPQMTTDQYGGWQELEVLQNWIAPELRGRYLDAAQELLEIIDDEVDPRSFQRIHGDCHKGNLLHNGEKFFLVDFDDFANGPIIQDFWMLLSGGDESDEELKALIYGYEELRQFPQEQIQWIPLLRTQRIIHYASWIAKRWNDPAFPKIFPDFLSYSYWAEEVEALEKILWDL